MSSFKRRDPAAAANPPGTRPSPSARSVLTISTGIPSLDDVLGGGLPLGHVLVTLTPDPHTAYGDLLQRHYIAQGLASGHDVCILDDSAINLAMGCMWSQTNKNEPDYTEEGDADPEGAGVKIAWRYENMKQFRTSVTSLKSTHDSYCVPLDLTCRIPEDLVNSAIASRQLQCARVSTEPREDTLKVAMATIEARLREKAVSEGSAQPLRLSIPSLGSPQWGDVTPANILRLLHALRALLRGNANVEPCTTAFITLPSYVADEEWGGLGWTQKLGWLSDGCITFRSFSSDPALTSMFPSHHGLVHIHTLPSPHTLVAASDKFSQLRGLSSFSSSSTSGGENNLAFKCTRKRFVIETLHLDVEGGVSERRTTAPVTANTGMVDSREAPALTSAMKESVGEPAEEPVEVAKKSKKSVTFRSDRPELYDF